MSVLKISAGSRLHFGLICGSVATGWRYGGVGLIIDQPSWQICMEFADKTSIDASEKVRQRIDRILQQAQDIYGQRIDVQINVSSTASLHNGLGAGTQLTLAIATGLDVLSGRGRSPAIQTAQRFSRGQRSCIGTYGFDSGGLIVDRGRDCSEIPDSLEVPTKWKFVLVAPQESEGLSGPREEHFFESSATVETHMVHRLADLIDDQIIPAVHQQNFPHFAASVAEYGTLAGDFFAKEQGGLYSSTILSFLAADLERDGFGTGVQSSWGPTICYPCQDLESAQNLVQRISYWDTADQLHCVVAGAKNCGARVASDADVYRTLR